MTHYMLWFKVKSNQIRIFRFRGDIMNSHFLRIFIFAFLLCLSTLIGTAKSFAQVNAPMDDQLRELQIEETVSQVELELKMQDC
jgi:hypothetical protein